MKGAATIGDHGARVGIGVDDLSDDHAVWSVLLSRAGWPRSQQAAASVSQYIRRGIAM